MVVLDDTSGGVILMFFAPTYLVVERIPELELIGGALCLGWRTVEPWTVPDTHWGSLCQLSFHVGQQFGGFRVFFFFFKAV